ncbi:hypothetical protein LEP1GSC062_3619 [Leptospira alexanderi serovar Manhao 3 str. L 60]|uniref:Uncharacterized protein n=1 Tax=Leptospira alexanderi serovar Manhao 3 str. L 60 TaxID=1049759 RepID=V6I886_9LEPT|nr:hypothetical protein LEP1GSC062_3619 [Leptospira alexanderi serovar Manhao 3 str. L 60]
MKNVFSQSGTKFVNFFQNSIRFFYFKKKGKETNYPEERYEKKTFTFTYNGDSVSAISTYTSSRRNESKRNSNFR